MRAAFWSAACRYLPVRCKPARELCGAELDEAGNDEDVERKGGRWRKGSKVVMQDWIGYLQTSATNGKDDLSGGSGVRGAVFNLVNTIVGASLTGLPFVVSASGIVPFMVFVTVAALLGYMTLCMLVTAASYLPEGKKDYQAVGGVALGSAGLKFSAMATCLSCYGALTSYFVLVGSTAPTLCKFLGVAVAPWKLEALAALAVIWPLCILKDISALAPASLYAVTVYALMAFASMSALFFHDDFYTSDAARAYNITQDLDRIKWFPDKFGLDAISKFPIVIMAFNCQYGLLPILASVRSGRSEDMQRVCAGGMGAAYVVYVLVAICAYLAYTGYTRDMILLNFRHCYHTECASEGTPLELCNKADIRELCEDSNPFVTMLNGLFLLAVLMGYPTTHFALRRAQVALAFGVDAAFSWHAHYGLAAFNIGLTLSVAVLVGSKVSVIFSWSGAVASPLISFVLPSLFYFLILGKGGLPLASKQRLLGLVVLGCGLFVMCLGIACNLLVPK